MKANPSDEEPFYLTEEQEKEILTREEAFRNSKTEARLWVDVLKDLEKRFAKDESQ